VSPETYNAHIRQLNMQLLALREEITALQTDAAWNEKILSAHRGTIEDMRRRIERRDETIEAQKREIEALWACLNNQDAVIQSTQEYLREATAVTPLTGFDDRVPRTLGN
jgi:chromosome segregation ATPase